MLKKIENFFKEVGVEVKKVNWPTPKETAKYTMIVIGVSVVIALFLGGIDFVFTNILEKFIL